MDTEFFLAEQSQQACVPAEKIPKRLGHLRAQDGFDLVQLGLQIRFIQLDDFRIRLHVTWPLA